MTSPAIAQAASDSMMHNPLLISSILDHAVRCHGDVEVVSRRCEGDIHRYTYADAAQRAKQLANALHAHGVTAGARVATLAWNGYRHFEIYYAASGMGAITHTINPRLFPEQIAYIANHAEDEILFFDLTFLPLVEAIASKLNSIKAYVLMADSTHLPASTTLPNLHGYEDFIAKLPADFVWPTLDENSPASLCYTSGTTGNPKGVLYTHRSTVLHAYGANAPDGFCLTSDSVVLPVVPMFHVNAWGTPYMCPAFGCKLVFPGPAMDGASLYQLFETEAVTMSAGVPTVWLGLLNYMRANNLRFSTFKETVIGGSACPPAMLREFEDVHGVGVIHAWGMTELSPLGTMCRLKRGQKLLSAEAQFAIKVKQGRSIFGVSMKIVGSDGAELPHDGKAFGDLHVRGSWVCAKYYKEAESALINGWFPTGDVATIDADGFMQITDRSKDVIKSGGEWISSIELENLAMAHPAVMEAAVIGVAHAKWDERPLLLVVRKKDATGGVISAVSAAELLQFYEGKIAKWWMPDEVVFVEALPHTATGKLLKTKLREDYRDYLLTNSSVPTFFIVAAAELADFHS